MKLRGLARARVLLLVLAAACALHAADWHIETADALGGKFTSLKVDKFGNAHVAYWDEQRHILKYAFWDHRLDKWFVEPLDMSAGFCSLALDSQQRPHVSYVEWGTPRIRYAYWDGTTWQHQTIHITAKEIASYTSIALDKQDNPTISFYEYVGAAGNMLMHLRSVTWSGKFWAVRTVDPTPGSGQFNYLALDSAGNPSIAYSNTNPSTASMRYAHWNGSSFDVEVLEGAAGDFAAYSPAIVVGKDDVPHITYLDAKQHTIKYAVPVNGKWHIETVDTVAAYAFPDRNGIALDENGEPWISYFDSGRGEFKLAHQEGTKWVSEVVDSNSAGFTGSLQITGGGVFLAYFDESAAGLKFAYRRTGAAGNQASVASAGTRP